MSSRDVSKEEFNDFVDNYPRKLVTDVAHVCEPPVLCYYDFEKYSGSDAIVATVLLQEAMKEHPAYKGEENSYKLHEYTETSRQECLGTADSLSYDSSKVTLTFAGKTIDSFAPGSVVTMDKGEPNEGDD